MMAFTSPTRHFAIASAIAVLLLEVSYAATLTAGFLTLHAPTDPISDPWFTLLEGLILLLMSAMLGLMVAIHAWAPASRKVYSMMAVIFMALLAGTTMSLHFLILTLGRQAAFAGQDWFGLLFAFRWPSIAYALDILAWDIFFALSMLCAAPVFGGNRLALSVRYTMLVSAALSLAGLAGAAMNDMNLRNIGMVGYLGVFTGVTALLLALFLRTSADVVQRSQ